MRTLVLATALAAALTLGGATAADAQGPAQDSVTGRAATCPSVDLDPESCLRAGPLPLPYIGLAADAVSGSSGQDPAGTMSWFEYPGGSMLFSGETQVTCLSVTGNVAIVGVAGTINFVSAFGGSFTRPTAGLIRVTDGGGPASGLDSFEFEPNLLRPPVEPLPGSTDCSSFPDGLDVRHNVGGDLVVRDVPPLPTSKDQCKNGGWRDSGAGFKNQGQCMAFVQRGPKP